MMLKNNLLILIVIFCCINCNYKKEQRLQFKNNYSYNSAVKIIPIDYQKIKKCFFSQLVNNIEYVSLETTAKSIIGSIDKIIFRNNLILILDKQISKAIFIFDEKGNFLNKIDRFGQGVGEYVELRDFTLNKNNIIEAYDGGMEKLIHFDIEGNFLNEKKLDIKFDFFEIDENYNYILATRKSENLIENKNSYFDILLFSDEFKLKKKYFEYNPNLTDGYSIHLEKSLYPVNEGVLYQEILNDTMYIVTDFVVKPLFILDFGDLKVPSKIHEINYREVRKLIRSSENIAFNQGLKAMTDDILIFSYIKDLKQVTGIYDKRAKNLCLCSEIVNDLDGVNYNLPSIHLKKNFVSVISALEMNSAIKKLRNKSKLSKYENELLLQFGNIDINNNPVLQFIEFKNE
jgi:hypothetical protein